MLDDAGRMLQLDRWPEAVAGAVLQRCGEPTAIERLNGMSLSTVWRVRGAAASLIVKASATDREPLFYERAAGPLRQAGVPIPRLEASIPAAGSHWLLLEDVPPRPSKRTLLEPDPEVVRVLGCLHAATRRSAPALPVPPVRHWTDEVTAGALACFPRSVRRDLAPRLQVIQSESERLVEPWCWISGDPNPSNWGMRSDGGLALFDWAEFRPGLPATDLAIAIAGLGDSAAFTAVAGSYRDAWEQADGPLSWSLPELSRDIAVAKVWTVIAFLDGHGRARVRAADGLIERLLSHVPTWLRHLKP